MLEGFEKVFDVLDEIIRIIRKSDGKQDAAKKIMARFDLDAEQTDAILELKLYRLARLEILAIRTELDQRRARATAIGALLVPLIRLLRDLVDPPLNIVSAFQAVPEESVSPWPPESIHRAFAAGVIVVVVVAGAEVVDVVAATDVVVVVA